jgi:Gpi18-like mannosyltransferase
MKVPASVADIGLAIIVAYALRDRPRWAVIGAAAILFHPAVIDVSAWWGQYESIYLLSALAAALLAINGRNGWAAAAIALSLMTKPQALPLLVPFAAWFWATGGWRGLVRATVIGVVVIALLWLPFIPAGGPGRYLHNLAEYQGDIFAIASLRAWNLWWLLQEIAARGNFIADDVAIVGPLTLRYLGLALAAVLELVVALAVLRDPRPRTFILGLAASVLVAFSFTTTMHERYAYGALVFLMLLITDPRLRVLSVAFGVVFTLNLLAAIPPTPEIGRLLPIAGALGVIGSLAMLAITYAVLRLLAPSGHDRAAAAEPP